MRNSKYMDINKQNRKITTVKIRAFEFEIVNNFKCLEIMTNNKSDRHFFNHRIQEGHKT